MEAAFLAEVTATEQLYRVTTGTAETFTITAGGALPRDQGFCQHVLSRGGPWVVPDAATDPVAATIPVRTVGDFGAYIGVPVRRPDGREYGSLCCISHHPEPGLGERDVAVLEALADILGFHIGQLEEAAEDRQQLTSDGADLAARLRQHKLQLGLMSELVEAARTPAMVLDPVSLRVDYANPAAIELLGAPPEQLLGTRVVDQALAWDEKIVRQRLAAVLDGEEPVVRFEVDDATDDRRILDVVAQRVETAGDSTAILLTGHDVTARRQAEQQLARALEREQVASSELRRLDSMRNAFLSAVSHELRTPLAAMRLVAETLQLGRVPPEMHPELLGRLLANADRLDRLLSDLLQLNQFTHGHLQVDRQSVRLDQLVRDAVAEIPPTVHDIELDLDPVEAAVAPVKFERIVVNLVHNAQVHTHGGTITVRLERTDEGALLAVRDEGPGLPAEDRERLFRPFEQGPTVPSHQPGTGIGLSLVGRVRRPARRSGVGPGPTRGRGRTVRPAAAGRGHGRRGHRHVALVHRGLRWMCSGPAPWVTTGHGRRWGAPLGWARRPGSRRMSKVRITIDGNVEDYEALSSFAKRAGTFIEEHEPGTLAWECFADESSGRVLWHEIYADADAFLAHMQHMGEEGFLDEFMQVMEINGVLSLARVTDERVNGVLADFGAAHLHGVTGVVR